ncbi:MAG: trypsin-like serine protease [Massilia sp.]|nr:trypsin-like serine protease [Massilia sp.]
MTFTPQASGTSGAQYTSTRVFPIYTGTAAPFSADRTFPYRAAGKLFFSINGAPYICSASVIARRIVATAGHCVHSGTASGFYSNFVFIPAFLDGTAPFGSWAPRLVGVTTTWSSGGGGVPNAADYAMMEMNDQTISGTVRRIGDLTDSLGWQTLSLASNHTSKLGYPANLDNARKMQNVMSDNFQAFAPNTVAYGSDAGGGSSGGPWVQNLEVASVGQNGNNLGSNRVVGITSYGPVDPAVKFAGSSILDSRWSTMYSTLCSARVGNC